MQNKKIVIVESPFAGDVDNNIKYAQLCVRDCLLRGESPFASHLLYTQDNILNDEVLEERELGIKAGFTYKHLPDTITIFYMDRGMSKGMQQAMDYVIKHNLPWGERLLGQ